MNAKQIQKFVLRYLQTTNCHIVEKGLGHVTVKLSPEADKDLTNRPYYWNFVERTGAPAETLTYTFVFDPEAQPEPTHAMPSRGPSAIQAASLAAQPATPGMTMPLAIQGSSAPESSIQTVQAPGSAAPSSGGSSDSILSRYFGFAPAPVAVRAPRDELTFGSRRLLQIFGIVKQKGRITQLFEEYKSQSGMRLQTAPYSTWFAVNFKVSYICDMKRDELHSLGISLAGGEMVESFNDKLLNLKLIPRVPANTYTIRNKMTLTKALERLEAAVEKKIRQQDSSWADEAQFRLDDELARIHGYYGELIAKLTDEDKRKEAQEQYDNRLREAEWQHGPRIEVSIVNCGLFHLLE